MDKRGTGIIRMNNFMGEWGLEKPAFRERTGYFTIIFKGPGKPIVKVPDERLMGLNERQRRIIRFIEKHETMTISDIQKMFNISRVAANKNVNELIKKDLILRRGVGKSTYYVLKMR